MTDPPRDPFAGPWFSAATAAAFLDIQGKEPAEAFRVWAKRHGVPTARRGSRVLYHRADVLRAIGAGHLHASRKHVA
jgi:hypothetical protein